MSTGTTTPNPANPQPNPSSRKGFVRRHPILSAVGVLGVTAVTYFGAAKYLSQPSNPQPLRGYETVVGNTNVVYEEVVPSAWEVKTIGNKTILNDDLNRMTFRGQTREYTLIDSLEETAIEPEKRIKPNFDKDKLEAMVVADKQWGVQIVYTLDQINDQTYLGEHVRKMFEIGNALYNSTRNQIRSEIIARQAKFQGDIENSLSAYQKTQAQAQTSVKTPDQLKKEQEFIESCKKALDKQMENYRASAQKAEAQTQSGCDKPKAEPIDNVRHLDNVRHGW